MNRNFEYLKYPPQLYQQEPKISQALGINLCGKPTRKFFYRVPYTDNENTHIQEFKKFAIKNNKTLNCNDTQILRYLYSTEFDYKDCLQKISIYLDWIHDPAIQTLSHKARMILNEGAIYTFGRDMQDRPIVYMDLSKIKFDCYDINDYYCAINAVLNLVVENCFVHGVVETYLFVIDMGGKNFTSLPMQAIGSIIKKLAIVYSMYLGAMLVINTQTFVKFTYTAVKIFIHEETRKKITLLDSKEIQKMSDYVDKNQLFRKHKGFIPDPFQYWPPQVPGLAKVRIYEEETIYYSVEENQSLFGDNSFSHAVQIPNEEGCWSYCNENNACNIF